MLHVTVKLLINTIQAHLNTVMILIAYTEFLPPMDLSLGVAV